LLVIDPRNLALMPGKRLHCRVLPGRTHHRLSLTNNQHITQHGDFSTHASQ
jgi:hypothetical protein